MVASVLSGNRNFEGRIHPEVKMNYLASPPLCVAYALAGRMDLDIVNEPLQGDTYLRDIWPTQAEVNEVIESAIESDMFRKSYGEVFEGDENWNGARHPRGRPLRVGSRLHLRQAPALLRGHGGRAARGLRADQGRPRDRAARRQRHDRPHLARRRDQEGLAGRQVPDRARRRAARLQLVRLTPREPRGDDPRHLREHPPAQPAGGPDTEGGWTIRDGKQETIYDAAVAYSEEGTPLCVLAGKEYGSGSSRDWAAKGPRLLGVRFVIAESYERIHRSNLVGMGVLPLQFPDGESVESLGLRGDETFDLAPLEDGARELHVTATPADGGDADRVRRARPHRHAERVAVLPPWRDPPLRAARAAAGLIQAGRN